MKSKLLIVILLVGTLLSGCSKTVLKADADPNADIASLQTFYVQKFEPDERGLEKIIADTLVKLGYQATSGTASTPPTPVDAVVTYTDRWMWDITMYMLEMNIQFEQPETAYVLATGNSYRTSLVRKSPEYMIEEVLREMLGKGPMPKADASKEEK